MTPRFSPSFKYSLPTVAKQRKEKTSQRYLSSDCICKVRHCCCCSGRPTTLHIEIHVWSCGFSLEEGMVGFFKKKKLFKTESHLKKNVL